MEPISQSYIACENNIVFSTSVTSVCMKICCRKLDLEDKGQLGVTNCKHMDFKPFNKKHHSVRHFL